MTRVYLADAQLVERAALRLLLLDLEMQVVGEAADWPTTLAQAPATRPDMVLVDWGLLATESSMALAALRAACPVGLVIALISHLDARHQAALSVGADVFISKGETPDRVAEWLRAAAESVRSGTSLRVSRLLPENRLENPAHFAAPGAGVNWGSLSEGQVARRWPEALV